MTGAASWRCKRNAFRDDLYNIAYLFRRDGTLGKQYKLHITPTERKWWGVKGGETVEVFDTNRGRIAIQICYDIAAECTPNIEMVAFEDLDLELLKRHRKSGSVLNWEDRRSDLYQVQYRSGVAEPKAPM